MTKSPSSDQSRQHPDELVASKRRRTAFMAGGFALWAVSISIPLGLFSAAHQAVLPVTQESLREGISASQDGWALVHVLAEDCACSRSVLEYLLERGSSSDYAEEVILVDGSEYLANRLTTAGFTVSKVEAEQLCSDFGSEGVPFFQVVEGGKEPAYSGAYFNSAFRGTNGFLDLSTAERLSSGGFVLSRPVYGCATSERLKAVLDPFGLK
ncbi:hypothetical protein [Pelagicoccus sp. SDUM812002]|uniref:hypothetical protein n=1 Tax=Pelagicoccus sp. SDUM812002 TaxID=3041266 RepID=UPI00280F6F4F|nr:hypothetical protein [Pelagicoccus sp. SDUM812002]MDQ8187012.1 hypothetical protein [Pelagicoccus sp. SDUM812002]